MTERVVKTKYNDDFRRFTLLETATFEELCQEVQNHYKLAQPFQVKYFDDEGDLITITNSGELSEAFKFSATQKPPNLRVTILTTPLSLNAQIQTPKPQPIEQKKAEPTPQPQKEQPKLVEQQKPVEEEKQYPVIPVSEWDAPTKISVAEQKPAVAIPVEKVAEIKTRQKTISEDTQSYASSTTNDVKNMSDSLMKELAIESDNIRLTTLSASSTTMGLMGERGNTNTLLCSDLSRQIAADCIALSRTTSDFCETIGKVASEDNVGKEIVRQVNSFSSSTLDLVGKLSRETAVMCNDLSTATIILSQHAEEQLKAAEMLKKQSEELQKIAKGVSDSSKEQSNQTLASSKFESNETLATIKNL